MISIKTKVKTQISADKLQSGQYGVAENGNLFFRTDSTCVCLTDPGKSWQYGEYANAIVTPLNIDDVITITVEK